MKKYILGLLLLFGLLHSTHVLASDFGDTTYSKIDTIICANLSDTVTLVSSLDTSMYNFFWVKKNNLSDTLSLTDSLVLSKSDSIVRRSIPKDTMNSALGTFIDTIHVAFHFSPVINLEIPSIECFNNLPIFVKINTNYDIGYVTEQISFYNELNELLTNVVNQKTPDGYTIEIKNGDTLDVKITYNVEGCQVVDTIFKIGTRFTPELNFESDIVCFGDSTTIKNLSMFDPALSDVKIVVDGISTPFTEKTDFQCYIDSNNDSRQVYAEINQDGCIAKDTFTIKNLLQPTAEFDSLKTCENEFLRIENKSSDTENSYNISIELANKMYTFGVASDYTLSDTIPDGTYPVKILLKNGNGCEDTYLGTVKIDPVTYVTFSGINNKYCELQDTDEFLGSQQGGSFMGLYIKDLVGQGKAIFEPLAAGSNIPITYTFTNFGCTDTETKLVPNVYPKPEIVLSGLLNPYCEKDPPTEMSINQSNNSNSTYTILRDGIFVNEINSINTEFDPDIPGSYKIINYYIDANGCFDTIESYTTVNPLPKIDLEPVKIIIPGDIIVAGNAFGNEINVNYEWSNGDLQSFTSLSQPGIYFLKAINSITQCSKSDSIEIVFDEAYQQEQLLKIKIFPNPVMEILNIEIGEIVSNIELLRLDGTNIVVNGKSKHDTDLSGELTLDLNNVPEGYYVLRIPTVGDFLIVKVL